MSYEERQQTKILDLIVKIQKEWSGYDSILQDIQWPR